LPREARRQFRSKKVRISSNKRTTDPGILLLFPNELSPILKLTADLTGSEFSGNNALPGYPCVTEA
jgi:hypothetical protein